MTERSVRDISVVMYPAGLTDNGMVRRFSALEKAVGLPYAGDEELDVIVRELIREGRGTKDVVILNNFQGRTVQECPCTRGVLGCGYHVINTCFGCLYDCTYCFLNSYLNTFGIRQIIDLDEILEKLEGIAAAGRGIRRIGTGEFTDSLMFDEVTGIASSIIERVKDSPRVMVEFKTKSSNIGHLLSIKEKGNAVLSWSINTETVISGYEADTAPLAERLGAAGRAANSGYLVAFHFDPIVDYRGCGEEYIRVVDLLMSAVPAERIAWISMGCFRFSPLFKDAIREKFPREALTCAELFPSFDGKFRYLKQKRVALYGLLYQRIIQYTDRIPVYLCMEPIEIWDSVFRPQGASAGEHLRRFNEKIADILSNR